MAIVAYSSSGGQLYREHEINTTETWEQAQRQSFQCRAGAGNVENSGSFGRGKSEDVCEQQGRAEFERTGEAVADAESQRLSNRSSEPMGGQRTREQESERSMRRTVESVLGGMVDGFSAGMDGDLDFLINHYWDDELDIPRVATGIKHKVDRLKCLGNAVVPQQFYPVFKAISEVENVYLI